MQHMENIKKSKIGTVAIKTTSEIKKIYALKCINTRFDSKVPLKA